MCKGVFHSSAKISASQIRSKYLSSVPLQKKISIYFSDLLERLYLLNPIPLFLGEGSLIFLIELGEKESTTTPFVHGAFFLNNQQPAPKKMV